MEHDATALRKVDLSKRIRNPLPSDGSDGLYYQSWYPVCLSDELARGQIIGCDFLGGRCVVFRGEDGEAQVMSAYCAHLGADLSVGQVVGNTVRCAFHYWQYDKSGACVCTAIGAPPPKSARLFAFPSTERYGIIWAFNGDRPLWEIPRYERDEDTMMMRSIRLEPAYTCDGWVFTCNTADVQHIRVVHGIQFTDEEFHDTVDWQEYGYDYRVSADHQGGISLDWMIGIRGASFFRQQGLYDGFWFGALSGFSCPKAGEHTVFLNLAVCQEDEAGRGRSAQERLEIATALLVRTAEEDRAILNSVHFTPGTLLKIDKSLARYFDYLRNYPRANPAAEFLV